MKIGIARALLYYYYFPLWKTLFEELGHEVVVSSPTNKALVNAGVKISVPELCVPIKIFNGHFLDLADKGVDRIFVPRMASLEKRRTFCPKFLGLPDMARYVFSDWEERLIRPELRVEDYSGLSLDALCTDPFFAAVPRGRLRRALCRAKAAWRRFRRICFRGYRLNEALVLWEKPGLPPRKKQDPKAICIGLMGYVYNVYDEFVSMNIAQRLEEMGASVLTFDMFPPRALAREIKDIRKKLFWTFSNWLLAAGLKFYRMPDVDGIIHVTAFGCGPDSLVGKYLELDSDRYRKPFMTIRVDEHTGENHLLTRIEAFTDMLRAKKERGAKA